MTRSGSRALLRALTWLALVVGVVLLSGCGTLSSHSDGPPVTSRDASNIPDAVPRAEPKSKRGNPKSYVVFGKRYYTLPSAAGFVERGIASWYGKKFHGRETSSGEIYDMYAMTAAHKQLPLPTYVRVTNLKTNALSWYVLTTVGRFTKAALSTFLTPARRSSIWFVTVPRLSRFAP